MEELCLETMVQINGIMEELLEKDADMSLDEFGRIFVRDLMRPRIKELINAEKQLKEIIENETEEEKDLLNELFNISVETAHGINPVTKKEIVLERYWFSAIENGREIGFYSDIENIENLTGKDLTLKERKVLLREFKNYLTQDIDFINDYDDVILAIDILEKDMHCLGLRSMVFVLTLIDQIMLNCFEPTDYDDITRFVGEDLNRIWMKINNIK